LPWLPKTRLENIFLFHVAKWRIINSQEAIMTSAGVAKALGGKKILGRSVKNFSDLADLIRSGLPSGSLIALGEKLDLKNAALSVFPSEH
jgi:hypothetical protein